MYKTKVFCGLVIFAAACSTNPQPGTSLYTAPINAVTRNSVKIDDPSFFNSVIDMVSRIPGVAVGAGKVIIRGVSTINGSTDPLIVVDGMPLSEFVPAYSTLSMMNTRDIARIDVLKDATAAIYGIRGGNGVILITTRR